MINKKSFVKAVKKAGQRFWPLAHCGHRTPREKVVDFNGEHIAVKIPLDAKKRPYYCVGCLLKMCVPCAFCHGRMLLPFERVFLPKVTHEFVLIPGALQHGDYVAVCTHPDCRVDLLHRTGMLYANPMSHHVFVTDIRNDDETFKYTLATSRHRQKRK